LTASPQSGSTSAAKIEAAAGAVAADHDSPAFPQERTIRSLGIVQCGRIWMLRRQPIIDRHDLDPSRVAQIGANIVMTVQAAQHEAAAVQIKQNGITARRSTPVTTDRKPPPPRPGFEPFLGRGYTRRVWRAERSTHPIIGRPVFRHRRRIRRSRVILLGARDERSDFGIKHR
jgi:hypothetical protein